MVELPGIVSSSPVCAMAAMGLLRVLAEDRGLPVTLGWRQELACIDGADTTCESIPLCAMSGRWNKVNRAIQVALEEVSLADMMPAPPAFKSAFKSATKSVPGELNSKIRTDDQSSDTKQEKEIGSAPK